MYPGCSLEGSDPGGIRFGGTGYGCHQVPSGSIVRYRQGRSRSVILLFGCALIRAQIGLYGIF